jgi:hypothetical protein
MNVPLMNKIKASKSKLDGPGVIYLLKLVDKWYVGRSMLDAGETPL